MRRVSTGKWLSFELSSTSIWRKISVISIARVHYGQQSKLGDLHNFGSNSLHCLGECLLELCTLYEVCLSFWRDHDIFFLRISKVTLTVYKQEKWSTGTYVISYLTSSSSLSPFAYAVQLLPGVIQQMWATVPVPTPWTLYTTHFSLMQLTSCVPQGSGTPNFEQN